MKILATQDHPFYPLVREHVVSTLPPEGEVVMDLTLSSRDRKERTLRELEGRTVISDLSCYPGMEWVEKYPYVEGALAGAFPSPKNACEVWVKNDRVGDMVDTFLRELGLTSVRVRSPGIGFVYPRIVAMIINEAWLAREDDLADAENIDLAMKNGVNYPWGPFEWGEKIGLEKVRMLLEELLRIHNNERYRPCSLLGRTP